MNSEFNGRALHGVIERLPDGAAKMAALLDAIHQADEAGDYRWRLGFRWDYTYEATFHDDPPKAMPMAAEFSAIYDENPGAAQRLGYGPAAYLNMMEMGMEPAVRLPQIPMEQYEALLAKFRDLTRRFGIGEQVYWWQMFFRWEFADLNEARKCLEKAWRAPKDQLSDCVACEHTRTAKMYLRLGDRETADRYAKPVWEHKIKPCASSFQELWQAYLHDALDRGDWAAARPLAETLQKNGCRDRGDLSYAASALYAWALMDTERALALFSRRLEWTFGMWDQMWLYEFYKAAWICFRESKEKTLALRLPEQFAQYRADGVYSAPELALWFYQQAQDIGARFDRRNRSDYFAKDLAKRVGDS